MPFGVQPPQGPEWIYEIKLDGYCAQALCDGDKTLLLSRNGKSLGQRFPALVPELGKAFPRGSIVDGELVALDPSGKPSFSLIQNSATSGATFVFFAFDLLKLKGKDLTQKSLSERRKLLRASLLTTEASSSQRASAFQPRRCLSWYGVIVSKGVSPSVFPAPTSREDAPVPGPSCAWNFLKSWL